MRVSGEIAGISPGKCTSSCHCIVYFDKEFDGFAGSCCAFIVYLSAFVFSTCTAWCKIVFFLSFSKFLHFLLLGKAFQGNVKVLNR